MRPSFPRLILMLGLLCLGAFAVRADEPPLLVLEGGALFDPVAGKFIADRTVIIKGSQIQAITEPDAALPPGARVIDCRGKYLLPGLIDAHVHLVHLANRSHVTGDQFLPMFLANGVTSVRDAGDEIVAQSVIARLAELRPELCPRVFLTSPLVDADPPLHRDVGYALTDPAKVRPFVEDMVQWQVTSLKIYVGTSRPVGRELINEGHRAGLKVLAHLGNYSAQDAVLDGVDSLEHIWSVFNYIIPSDVTAEADHRANLDLQNPLAQALIAVIAERQVQVDPTLVVFRNMIYLNDLEEIHRHPDLQHVPQRMLDYWHSYRQTSNLSPETRETRRKEIQKYQELTGLLHHAGVPLLAGTDTPEPFVPPGFSLHQELEMLVESGLSPAAALTAATINNAKALNQQDCLGTIAPGKLADVVILDADPTLDIRNTRQIHAVVRGGLLCNPAIILQAVPAK
ncbi:MAG: amidohydrolase family protein [Pirellulaceae bacterium]